MSLQNIQQITAQHTIHSTNRMMASRVPRQPEKGLKLSVGSGIEGMVSHPVQPIRTVHFENPPDRLTDSPTDLNP